MCLRMHLYVGAYTNYKYQDSRYLILLRKYCAIMKKKLYDMKTQGNYLLYLKNYIEIIIQKRL